MDGAAVAEAVDLQLLLHVLDGHHGRREEIKFKGRLLREDVHALGVGDVAGRRRAVSRRDFQPSTPPTTSLRDRIQV